MCEIDAVQFRVGHKKVKIQSKNLNVRSSDPFRSVSVCTGLLRIALRDCAFHCQGQHHRPNCCFQTGGLLWLDVACLCKPGWVWKIIAWSLLFQRRSTSYRHAPVGKQPWLLMAQLPTMRSACHTLLQHRA